MKALLCAAGLLLALPAGAQPWRYEKDGAVYYTSNVNELPPKLRARVLAERAAKEKAAAEAKAAAAASPPPSAPVVPRAESRPGRIKGQAARPAGTPMPSDVGERPAPPPKPVAEAPEAETPAERKARLLEELAAARHALADARRQALLIPDGHTYTVRAAAEKRVAELERELATVE